MSHTVVAVLGVVTLKISCVQSVHDIDVHDIYFNVVGGINTMEGNMCKFHCTSFAGFNFYHFFSVRIAKLVNISVVDFVKILQFKYILE